MNEGQGPNYLTQHIKSKAFALPEGVTVMGACELLRLLSADLAEIKLPSGDALTLTHIIRDADGQHSFATLMHYFPKP
jgi:hypothetical protein